MIKVEHYNFEPGRTPSHHSLHSFGLDLHDDDLSEYEGKLEKIGTIEIDPFFVESVEVIDTTMVKLVRDHDRDADKASWTDVRVCLYRYTMASGRQLLTTKPIKNTLGASTILENTTFRARRSYTTGTGPL